MSTSEPDGEFKDKVALVTGAAGIGIGRAVARRLAAAQATVVVTDVHDRRTRETVQALSAEFPRSDVVGYLMDVGVRDDVDRTLAAVRAQWGPIRLVVNNAAVNWPGPIWDYDLAHFDRTIEVNVSGPWYICRQTMVDMRDNGGGAIVNIGSTATHDGGRFGTEGVYAMTKGALQTMTVALAADGGPYAIRVNTVAPGVVAGTKFINDHPDQLERARPLTPLGALPTPDDVAEAAAFLLSARAAYITGQTIVL
jgi:NAD(P)-dependent dehydrogenase (short-subunit alcohol dehydrogenase family)